MDPLEGTAESLTVNLVGTAVDAIPGLQGVGAELGIEFRHGGELDLEATDPSLVLCDGNDGLRSIARRELDAPILPIEPPRTTSDSTDATVEWDSDHTPPFGVAPAETADAIRTLFEIGGDTRRLATLSIETDTTSELAVRDLALVTTEPGAIATFTATSRGDPITEVRADGLVVATPAGSRGFAHAAGGPTLEWELDAVTVVALSPFTTDIAPWVGSPDGLELSIASDGPDAQLQCDGHVRRTIPAGSTMAIAPGPDLSIVTPADLD
ncbi:putative sugar kinase [Halovivax ruber XH-70]|uniref:Putative sugar kinase n=1 Tax=Halovivax ruber (strain DSM 18193 / JCM 13892 / XH-70) TaxID=797302 RepID=L0I772_HALRX|nr:NAD(+)/NADH kinase [Halovivax ruber]AGB15405.1 putative sugar kinase [Halovivax ruber XH-70]